MESKRPTISAILPVYNERENLDALLDRLPPVLESATDGSFEIMFVDDGSRDGSAEILDSFCSRDSLRVIHFSRNFGHQAALQAGLDAASGDAVIIMDADLQDPPEVLHQFIEKWRQGYDVVYAVRRKRKENWLKRAAYSIFYRSMKVIAEIDVPLDVGDFCLMDRRVVDMLVTLRERHRFLRGLRSWVGFRQIGIEYQRDARLAGAPKYTLRKLVSLALSGYIGFSSMPLSGRLARLLVGRCGVQHWHMGPGEDADRVAESASRVGFDHVSDIVRGRRSTSCPRYHWRIFGSRL